MTNKTTNKDCVFCRMASGEIPVNKIYEDEKFFCFLDICPINPGHLLVIPKKHDDYIFELNDKEYLELMSKTKEIAKLLKSKLKPKRVGMAVEGFGVSHIHVHLVPINKSNELNQERKKMTEKELNKIAEKIKNG
ncbi:HIT domain protein [uncultured archaeon]|nr:HIT domain protein [uncultured archaeon]